MRVYRRMLTGGGGDGSDGSDGGDNVDAVSMRARCVPRAPFGRSVSLRLDRRRGVPYDMVLTMPHRPHPMRSASIDTSQSPHVHSAKRVGRRAGTMNVRVCVCNHALLILFGVRVCGIPFDSPFFTQFVYAICFSAIINPCMCACVCIRFERVRDHCAAKRCCWI